MLAWELCAELYIKLAKDGSEYSSNCTEYVEAPFTIAHSKYSVPG